LSVVNQTHQDFEIILKEGCVDNPVGNNPRIAALIESLGSKIKYTVSPDGQLKEQNSFYKHNGFYQALNECVLASTGDLITLLASDDERGPSDTLAYVNERFEQHGPAPFFLYGQCEWVDADNNPLEIKEPAVIPMTREALIDAYTLYTPALFWNRMVHRQFGLFDELNCPWCADLDFWLRCWNAIDTEYAPRILGRYRIWGVSQCRESGDLQKPEADMIRARHGKKHES
jgi:glycosyltransferase involved in cell wall biosynthesis